MSCSDSHSYSFNIWCDVLPINVAQILLGQPWVEDLVVDHDEESNTYTFKNGSKFIKLVRAKPISRIEQVVDDTPNVPPAKTLEDSQIETKPMKKIRDEPKHLTLLETSYIEFVIPHHFTQTTESM